MSATKTAKSNAKSNTAAAPKVCAISLQDFRAGATPLVITVNGIPMVAEVKEFSTGSYGFYCNGKVSVKIGDVSVPVQCGFNMTVVNSNPNK